MESILLLVVGVPVALAVWLIARSIIAGERVAELSRRVAALELEVLALRGQKLVPEAKTPASAPQPAREPEPMPAAAPAPVSPPTIVPAAPAVPALPLPPVVPESLRAAQQEWPPEQVPVFAEAAESPSAKAGGAETPSPGSFEMRLGTYWLVRAGVVMLLTGLVFFGNYAYQNFVGKLGPGGKVSLLYVASALLLGLGFWGQRRAKKESLQNYAQVLFAGGLAAVYFTTYAAHHIPQLCIISSVTLDGLLLLGWAGFMAWIADRRKSEVLAFFAVGLAYYTAAITQVGPFTLYSNFVLTAAAVFFLLRQRWVGLSFASLLATYVSYAFWRFCHAGDWHWARPGEQLWFGALFLLSYWGLFTAAAFLSKAEKLAGSRRAGFVTLNNGAFFSLFLLTMLEVQSGGFWKFAMTYGLALLGLSGAARRALPGEPIVGNSYLTQGLLLVTLGLVSKFAGLQLALVLGFESVVLLMLGTLQESRVQIFGAHMAAALAVTWGGIGLCRSAENNVWAGVALGGFLIVNAVWLHRQKGPLAGRLFRPAPGYYVLLALATWFATTWFNTSPANLPLALALEAAGLTLSIYLLGLPEITVAGQSFLVCAQIFWLSHALDPGESVSWWRPALLVLITLALSHWWQHQKTVVSALPLRSFWQALYALALVALLYLWLQPLASPPVWLALASLLAVVIALYGALARAWWLAAAGQIFLLVSGAQFVLQLWDNKPDWYLPLTPLAALALLSLAAPAWLARPEYLEAPLRPPLLGVARAYRWMAMVLSLDWLFTYVPECVRICVIMGLGLLVFLFAGWRKNREALLLGAAYSSVGLTLMWNPLALDQLVSPPNLDVLLLFLGQQQLARRRPACYPVEPPVHAVAIMAGCATLWWFVSRSVMAQANGSYLTATWAALSLALLVGGIVLGEKVYRWSGLAVLGAALARVIMIDVWKQETIYRVLTFMALGAVLLVLGFLYNKYQDKIRRWL